MSKGYCLECKYYYRNECRRYAPRPKLEGKGISYPIRAANWPVVDPNEFCGEFEPKKRRTNESND